MQFGEVLAVERRSSGLSQHRLALVVETTQRHISFLETGRSRPTREMILRISDALALRPGRRADLFAAAGFTSGYRRRPADDAVVVDALRRLERYILEPWPYPALALTETWDVLAANTRGRSLFNLPEQIEEKRPNLFDILLTPQFRAAISNWPDVAAVVCSRLRRHAVDYPDFRGRLETAAAAGVFDNAAAQPGQEANAAILPLIFALPDGRSFSMTSMTARLTSAQDDFISGLEIELCIPLDDKSDAILRG